MNNIKSSKILDVVKINESKEQYEGILNSKPLVVKFSKVGKFETGKEKEGYRILGIWQHSESESSFFLGEKKGKLYECAIPYLQFSRKDVKR